MTSRCSLARSVACALALATCIPVRAQDFEETAAPNSATERARVHFRIGVDFYHEGNFRAALIEFKRAYKAAPHYKLLYNLGQVSLELQEDASAIDYFTNYLREGADELSAERKLEVQQDLIRLQARLAHAVISTDQVGAEIYVDDTLVGSSPLADPVRLSVGRRRITVKKRGFVTAEHTLDVAAGDNLVVALDLKDRTPDLSNLQLANTEQRDGSVSAAAWGGIATAVLGVSAITFTVLTAVAQASYDSERRKLTSETKLQDLRAQARLKALGADISWGGMIAAAGVTTVLLLTSSGSEHGGAPSDDKKGVKINLGAGNLQLRGRF